MCSTVQSRKSRELRERRTGTLQMYPRTLVLLYPRGTPFHLHIDIRAQIHPSSKQNIHVAASTHPRTHASTPSFGFFSFLPLASAFLRSTPFAFCHFWCHSLFFFFNLSFSLSSIPLPSIPPSPYTLFYFLDFCPRVKCNTSSGDTR